MSRLTPFLGILAGVTLGVLAVSFVGSRTVVESDASSKLSLIIPTLTPSTEMSPAFVEATSTPKKVVPLKKETSKSVEPLPATPLPAPTPTTNVPVPDVVASELRGALVNILCYAPAGGSIHSISGSGVIIDPKGIIITNAHVAQYLLLKDRGVDCTIRSGSPALDRYEASLIYISPSWLRANPRVLTETLPNGTGEYDFALAAITKSTTRDSLPSTFPFLPLATRPSVTGVPVVIASYGAQFIASSQIQSSLFPTVVFGSVKDIFTFGTKTIDVIALGGSAAAQEGSSGGGVADAYGNLVGVITTSTVTGATDTRSLDAITASYIRAQYATETGSALDILLSKDTATSVAGYASQLSDLEAIITTGLP